MIISKKSQLDGGLESEGIKKMAELSVSTPLKTRPSSGKESEVDGEDQTSAFSEAPRKCSPPHRNICNKVNEFYIKYDDLKPAFKLYFERESGKEIEITEDDDWD